MCVCVCVSMHACVCAGVQVTVYRCTILYRVEEPVHFNSAQHERERKRTLESARVGVAQQCTSHQYLCLSSLWCHDYIPIMLLWEQLHLSTPKLHFTTSVHPCWPLLTSADHCLPMFSTVYPCFPLHPCQVQSHHIVGRCTYHITNYINKICTTEWY